MVLPRTSLSDPLFFTDEDWWGCMIACLIFGKYFSVLKKWAHSAKNGLWHGNERSGAFSAAMLFSLGTSGHVKRFVSF